MKKHRWRSMAAALVLLVPLAAAAFPEEEVYTTKTVTVCPGDTLWGLWEEHGHGRADKWMAEVRDMNGMDSADIYPMDVLCVPVIEERK